MIDTTTKAVSNAESTSARLIKEGLIDLDKAAEIAGVSRDSVWRWATRGKSKVKLESVEFVKGHFRTSGAALARFSDATKLRDQSTS